MIELIVAIIILSFPIGALIIIMGSIIISIFKKEPEPDHYLPDWA